MRTAFVGFVDNIEFTGDSEVEKHRYEENSEKEGITSEGWQVSFMCRINYLSKFQ